jgi:hypothetical protein
MNSALPLGFLKILEVEMQDYIHQKELLKSNYYLIVPIGYSIGLIRLIDQTKKIIRG